MYIKPVPLSTGALLPVQWEIFPLCTANSIEKWVPCKVLLPWGHNKTLHQPGEETVSLMLHVNVEHHATSCC